MNGTILAALISILLLFILVTLPLIPAVVIYRLFPNTQVAASGPFAGLTLKSSGAFSAYIVVFVGMVPFAYRTYDSVGFVASPSWTISGRLALTGPDGKLVDNPAVLGNVKVELYPSNIDVKDGMFTVEVPAINNAIPQLIFDFGVVGLRQVNVNDLTGVRQKRSGSGIALLDPVSVTMNTTKTTPYDFSVTPLQAQP